jgi:hypothetical protein
MGFIPDSEIEKQQKIQEINRKVQIKREQHLITEKANEPTAKKNENITFMREIEKANRHNKPPKPIGLKEIKQQLEFQKLIVENQEEQIRGLLAEPEMMEIKNELVNVMAIPHTHPDKRRLFAHKLQNSQTVTNYVDQNVMFRFFNHANSHIKLAQEKKAEATAEDSDSESLASATSQVIEPAPNPAPAAAAATQATEAPILASRNPVLDPANPAPAPAPAPARAPAEPQQTLDEQQAYERKLKDELATKRQMQLGRNPNHIDYRKQTVNLQHVLNQLRIPSSYNELVHIDPYYKRPDPRNLTLIDPFQ